MDCDESWKWSRPPCGIEVAATRSRRREWVPVRDPLRGISARPTPSLAARSEGAGSSGSGRAAGVLRIANTGLVRELPKR